MSKKVVVYDCGYGGEFFADELKEELPFIEIIRVIDWRRAGEIQTDAKKARNIAKEDLRPYIGKVDLIIFANHFLTMTSLKHFKRKYKNQSFAGMKLPHLKATRKNDILILTTRAVTKTINYYNFIIRLRMKPKTLALDAWPEKIDDGELTEQEIIDTLQNAVTDKKDIKEIVLACSQFHDIKPELMRYFKYNIKIYDSFDATLRETCKILRIRGGIKKLKR